LHQRILLPEYDLPVPDELDLLEEEDDLVDEPLDDLVDDLVDDPVDVPDFESEDVSEIVLKNLLHPLSELESDSLELV
jgi:hypothetical protein